MLLDVAVTADGNAVLTCDRDEKLRVSQFPTAYNILGYCLGHTEFVSAVLQPPGLPELVLSGSGDGTVRLWRLSDCAELDVFTVPGDDAGASAASGRRIVRQLCALDDAGAFAVVVDKVPRLYSLAVREGKLVCLGSSDAGGEVRSLVRGPDARLWACVMAPAATLVELAHTPEADNDAGPIQRLEPTEAVAKAGEALAECAAAPAADVRDLSNLVKQTDRPPLQHRGGREGGAGGGAGGSGGGGGCGDGKKRNRNKRRHSPEATEANRRS